MNVIHVKYKNNTIKYLIIDLFHEYKVLYALREKSCDFMNSSNLTLYYIEFFFNPNNDIKMYKSISLYLSSHVNLCNFISLKIH